jgi:hypothetical protein
MRGLCTGYTQKNDAVSKVDKNYISHPTRAQHTLSAAGTLDVSYALKIVHFSCLLQGLGSSIQDGVAEEEVFCVLRFEVSTSVITIQREFCPRFVKDIILVWCVFYKPCTKQKPHCNHRTGHLKPEHSESLLLLRRHLGKWTRAP